MNSSQEELRDLFLSWKDHPVTKELFSVLEQRIKIRQDLWVNGNLMADTAHVTAINDAMNQGYCRALYDVMNISHEELVDESVGS
jgi:hypothetical protein